MIPPSAGQLSGQPFRYGRKSREIYLNFWYTIYLIAGAFGKEGFSECTLPVQ